MDGRVLAGGRFLGLGFCVTDREVVTAEHVIRGVESDELSFVTTAGVKVAVDSVRFDHSADLALLRVAQSIAVVAPLAHAQRKAEWCVRFGPVLGDVQLWGTVTAVDHMIRNARGNRHRVLQLQVNETIASYHGYSGGAVIVDGAVVGVLVEQVHERGGPLLPPRAANVLYAVPIHSVVERFGLGVAIRTHKESLPTVQRLLDTAFFDLDALKTAVLDARARDLGRLLGFGVECRDPIVVRNLSDWLPHHLGRMECRGELSLRADLTSPDTAVKIITRYLPTLDRIGVVCPIRVDGAAPGSVAEFWAGIRDQCHSIPNWLVLLFTSHRLDALPEGVTRLPRPRFVPADILTWAQHVAEMRGWPESLATVWADLMIQTSTEGDGLDVRFTYETLEDSIRRVWLEPEELLELLRRQEQKEVSQRANSPSR